jgi:SAM-dependent methyltransferase
MNRKEFNQFNKTAWNDLITSNSTYSNASLPNYGPFMSNESTLRLFKDIKDKKVLELGCASGKSLEFLANKGASELWGIDISKEQIKQAQSLNIKNSHFYISTMEENPGLPANYFDYVVSLYSIGYSSKPTKTIRLASSYLKQGGSFILSWSHPFFNCLDIQDNNIIIKHNYNDESPQTITKGSAKINVLQHNLKISTLVNTMIELGLVIDKIIEEEPDENHKLNNYDSPYFNKDKLKCAPTTLIIIAHKN